MGPCAQRNCTREALERLRPEVHSCLIYDTAEEQFAAAVPLMALGLERGEKCIYLCEESHRGPVLEAMQRHGIDTNAAIQSGALTVGPSRLLAEAARRSNGSPVRLARQVTGARGKVVELSRIAEYQLEVEALFAGKKVLYVALYQRDRVSPEVLLEVIRSHPLVIWNGTVCDNLHAGLVDERLAPDPTTQEVERVLVNLRDRQRIEDDLRERSRNGAVRPVEAPRSGPPPSGCATCLSKVATFQEQILHAEKMEALGRMAAGMVNEFRNALTGVLGFTELLMDTLEPEDRRMKLARQIFAAGQSANVLTNQLLAFGNPAAVRPEVLDLNAAISEITAVLRCSLKGRSELRVLPAADACPVKVHRGQLEQVLLNLVLNARDAMPQGGTLTIQTKRTGSGAEPEVALSVSDTGLGMDDNMRLRVFDPFFTTKGPGLGAGLGLSIVYGIVQQFGGSISVDSRPGTGTTVTVYLPLAETVAAG